MNTSKDKKISAIITSGGVSKRFGSNKLLEKINDFSVIETTISKFIDIVDEIIIPTGDEVKNHLLNSKIYNSKINFALSGSTRQKSVYNGLQVCSNPDIVLIHDGARPYIDRETILKTIDLTFEKGAVVVGFFETDTIKVVENGKIIKTLDRKNIFHAQTPQAFNYKLIKEIHEFYLDRDDFTDDSSMAESYNVETYIIECSKANKKITFKEDLN